ncbi:MAG: hypothetical protein R3200_05620 [Xanthomonadales bacterium]|nr:hypothetical protein [Xanthomonadales bacterium]
MKWILLAVLLLSGTAFAQDDRARTGDRLLIEKVRSAQGAQVPDTGMLMEDVEARYGAPVSRTPPVGEPPITRWDYGDFSVYFEHSTVIHSVLRRQVGGEDVS